MVVAGGDDLERENSMFRYVVVDDEKTDEMGTDYFHSDFQQLHVGAHYC